MKTKIKLSGWRNRALGEIALDATECEFAVQGKVSLPEVEASGRIVIFGFGVEFAFDIDLRYLHGAFVSLLVRCPVATLDLEVFVYQDDYDYVVDPSGMGTHTTLQSALDDALESGEDEDEANDCC